MKKKVFMAGIPAVVLSIYCISFIMLFGKQNTFFLENKATRSMLCELIAFWGISYFLNRYIKNKRYLYAVNGIELLFFAYIHVMLFPILVNAVYFLFLFSIGYLFLDLLRMDRSFWKCFVAGISAAIILECVLSLAEAGSNSNFLLAISTAGICGIINVFCKNRRILSAIWRDYDVSEHNRHAFGISVILTVFALLIGRCNRALDYDGYWYGLRPDYLLNSGNSIYDRIPAVSLPNIYPKGYEILILPLAELPSYSFMLAFNIFIGVLILIAAGNIIKAMNKKGAMNAVCLLATIPGVMSMCTTVKQDSITLLCQMIMIYFAVLLRRRYDSENLMMVLAAYFLSLNMKSTSLVFSSIILLVTLLFCIVNHSAIKWSKKGIVMTLLTVCVTALVSLRTYLLCGYPYTSLLIRLWQLFGLKPKGPYVIAEPTASMGLSMIMTPEGIIAALKKIITTFCLPVTFTGVITDHILLAWGTPLVTVFFVGILFLCVKKRNQDKIQKMLLSMYLFVLLASVYSIASLYKNDGNYYMLLYVLSVLVFVSLSDTAVLAYKHIRMTFYPVVIANILIFSMTGWAGAGSFSKIDLVNRGYFDHKMDFADFMKNSGKETIYRYFSSHEVDKVLGFGSITIVDRFPCLIESAVEIFAYGGEKYLASYEEFLALLEDTGTSEIYIDDSFDYSDDRIITYLTKLVYEDKVKKIITENENFILIMNYDNNDNTSELLNEEEKVIFVEMMQNARLSHLPSLP